MNIIKINTKGFRDRIFLSNRMCHVEQTLEVQLKTAYGVDRIYPMNETAKKLAALMQAKTFTKSDLVKIKDIGFKIKWVPIELP